MKQIEDYEVKNVRAIASAFSRHPWQINNFLESDAEIIEFNNKSIQYLVLKIDGIHEEINKKLYVDPFLIGWMSITVTISDLAAVGALPFGILLSIQIPYEIDKVWFRHFQKGINNACKIYQVNILGGDTNYDSSIAIVTTGIGTIADREKTLFRKKMTAGEMLYSTGKLGLGNAFAYAQYFDNSIKIKYQPTARLRESKLISDYATACMDTSDGLFPALSVLSEINHVGFNLVGSLQNIVHDEVLKIEKASKLPLWIFLAGPHGEYELLFSIPVSKQKEFEDACRADNWTPIFIGEIVSNKKIQFISNNKTIKCQPAVIPNLFHKCNSNIQLYFDLLMKQDANW
ncbi:thiamine-phosphate kinase [Flavobacterium maritimum]|uniref:thiamine-phosphate kinase n=1 Tax=Flavobacterium maritimum TaxID=3149042 RepID=UPI0032B37626